MGIVINQDSLKKLIIDKLKEKNDDIKKQWSSPEGTATRYFYIDDLLPVEIASLIFDAFPKDGEAFHKRESFRERKSTLAELAKTSTLLGDVTTAFQFSDVIEEISSAIDMKSLHADSSLYAGGLSMMFPGDFLNPHIDNSHDGDRKMYRRLNLLYYVTPNWKLEDGGNFELWNSDVTVPNTIVSRFNRLVVMETNDSSWHSVSPVTSSASRCCVSNYYFSNESPSGADYFHVTSFTGRPGETSKRFVGLIDNAIRNTISKVLKTGRGKDEINKIE
ncbi:2OG-Fe(II) oxygenase [Marinomonas sp. S3726]|uniref:2OG-Fe(II) oxygenase n=1 Tax=Marinomonas sp. S3726 TaxID=579484 RepID=UPI0005FA3BED|nr:2OG-Fe(II) oxygenase [Marinomonas sp. S3726]KJZ13618.1 2OG-Fe(II) oxygenase [Marinomonas sp. S3726]